MADAERAITLAPQEANGYRRAEFCGRTSAGTGTVLSGRGEARALDPACVEVQGNYATLLERLGRLPEAIAVGRKATEIDPLSAIAWSNLGLYLTFHKDYPAADEALRRCLEINPESSFGGHHLAILRLLEGDAAAALATARKIGIEGFRLTDVAMAEHSLGHAGIQQALAELIANFLGRLQVAEALAWRGRGQGVRVARARVPTARWRPFRGQSRPAARAPARRFALQGTTKENEPAGGSTFA